METLIQGLYFSGRYLPWSNIVWREYKPKWGKWNYLTERNFPSVTATKPPEVS